ncbi:MAG: hypothetical protein AB7J28_08960 [Hyphomonadaceae bacterium]
MDHEIVQAWRDAASDLGIRVTAPYELETEDGVLMCEAFAPDFGSTAGAIAVSRATADNAAGRLTGPAVPWRSILYEIYRRYDRELFIEMLEDWGWFGARAETPAWYKGHHYGE